MMRDSAVVRELFGGYARDAGDDHPLAGYATIVGAFNAAFAGFVALSRTSPTPLPERPQLSDLLLLGVATHKLGRLIARDVVTSFVRAPFTRYESQGDLPNEVNERARGRGLRRAIGELLVCPPCVDTWVAAFLAYALALWPRPTRQFAGIFTALAVADFLQVAYLAAHSRQEPARPSRPRSTRTKVRGTASAGQDSAARGAPPRLVA